MSVGPGTKLAQYEIQAAIGSGGMEDVYRALDTKLGREVAVKVVREAIARDRERLARLKFGSLLR